MSDYPELPAALDGKINADDLNQLWNALLVELADPIWFNRKHYNRRTYDAGCQGPMCTKAVREHARQRNQTNPSERYAKIDAVLEHWFLPASELVSEVKQKLLTGIVMER